MKYYKLIENGIITMIGSGSKVHETQTEITPEKHAELDYKFKNRPEDTFESVYYFDNATETYLPRERTEEEKTQWYVTVVQAGTITIDEVPEEYREAVQAKMPQEEDVTQTVEYQAGYDQAVLDLLQEV